MYKKIINGQVSLFICTIVVFFLFFQPQSRGETFLIKDAFNREVQVPKRVNRIIAIGSSMAFVSYLKAQDRVVGVEDIEKTDLTKPYVIANKDLVKDLPIVCKAGAVRIPNYEKIISLKPDLVFVFCTDTSEPDLLERKLRIPVLALSQGTPNFDEEAFFKSIRLTGQVLGLQENAEKLIAKVMALKDELYFKADEKERAEAYIGGLSYKGSQGLNSSAGNFFPMQMAGVTNLTDRLEKKGHVFINKEFLLNLNPAKMFIDGNGLPLLEESLKGDAGFFKRLRAMQDGNLWLLLPNTSYFNNPEIMYINAFYIAKVLYPEKYKDLDPIKKADEIFMLFNHKPLYEEFQKRTGGFKRLRLEKGRLVALDGHD